MDGPLASAPPASEQPALSPRAPGLSAAAIDPTEFKLGWRILVLAMLGVAVNANSSMLYAFGALTIPLQEALGWERGQMQGAVSVLFAGAVIGSQLVGWLNLRFGMRPVTLVSLASLSLVFVAMTQMGRSIVWLYAMFAVLPMASLGTMQVTWTHLVNLWFIRNRGLALALVLSGTGLAATLIPSAVTWATTRWGWQAAFWLLAALPAGLVLPFTLRWMVEPDAQRAATTAAGRKAAAEATALRLQGIRFREGIRTPRYWTLNLALSLVVAAVVTMVTTTVPLLRDKGLSAAEAGTVFGGFGLSLIAGRVVVGYLIDRLWAPGVAAVALALPALGCWLLFQGTAADTTLLVAAAMLLGAGAGAEFDIAAYLVARYYGMRDYGRLFGVHLGLITVASAIAPLVSGALYRAAGTYTPTLALCGGAFLAGALMLLPLGRYPVFSDT